MGYTINYQPRLVIAWFLKHQQHDSRSDWWLYPWKPRRCNRGWDAWTVGWSLWHKSVATFTGKNTITPWKTNMVLENQPWMKMYLLLKMVISQPGMLVVVGVHVQNFGGFQFFFRLRRDLRWHHRHHRPWYPGIIDFHAEIFYIIDMIWLFW